MSHPRRGVSRRGFLLGAACGAAVAGPLGWLAARRPAPAGTDTAARTFDPSDVMPGRYPGRVVEVRDPTAVSPDNVIDPRAVAAMVDRGMAGLTGYEPGDPLAWKSLFARDDVVGVKVNPVGKKSSANPTAVGAISSFELLHKVVACLRAVGVPADNIVVFDRYAAEFCEAGYKDFVERELPGVRWLCASSGYSGQQLDLSGHDPDSRTLAPEVMRRVAGYDPDVFTTMGYCLPNHSTRDDRRFRSHLTVIVSRFVSKMITLPVLKDHRSAGVTLALKNMSHGMNNNVARSHLSGLAHGFDHPAKVLGPNQCNTFIPQAVAQSRLREKATLHILDGLIGVYEGGPGVWNRSWGTWRRGSLFFATDPVALDHVGWQVIDEKRAEMGWAAVERMGLLYRTDATDPASAAAPLAAAGPLAALTLSAAAGNLIESRATEAFNVRQPDHIALAGQLGLGVFDRPVWEVVSRQ
jgi:hypothetical protein